MSETKEVIDQDALAAEWGLALEADAANSQQTAGAASAEAAPDVAPRPRVAAGLVVEMGRQFVQGGQRRRGAHSQSGRNRRAFGFSLRGYLPQRQFPYPGDHRFGDGLLRAVADAGTVFDRLVRLMTTSLRNFTSDNVEVSLDRITSVRFGDYLNSIPLPAILAVFKAEEWDNFGLITVNSSLIYSIIDVLLGGRRGGHAIRVEGRPYTTIESNLVKRMIEVVLADAELAFKPLSPVKFNIDRLETNPRFAAISRPANAAIRVRLRIDMEDRGGNVELLLPYATIEPIREVLLQMFMGEKFGRDPIWEGHLATEIGQAEIAVNAVLYEAKLPLKQLMKLEVGDTLPLEIKADAFVTVRCGDVTLTEGRMGRVGDRIAVRVSKPLRKPRTTFAMFENSDRSTNRMEGP